MLTISVVIPVKNDAVALRACMAALAVQTVPPDEIIVVYNGSCDETVRVARGLGARVITESVPGIPAAASAGYDAARFDVIGRLDADSVAPPTWIEDGIRILTADPGIDALTGSGSFYDGPRRGSRTIAALYLGAYFGTFKLTLGETPLFGSNFFIRRRAWQSVATSVHRSGVHIHDDLDLTIHLTPNHRIAFDPAITVGISYRPFTHASSFVLRVQRGFWTLLRNWPRSSSTLRWRRKLLNRQRTIRTNYKGTRFTQ
ncbi:glycosyltransferase family 2 protein [Subtercola sp. YIM 133946]|uniref:glycosyltransferase family 2 protein n=1 Tax=Subtercola sp. YIM 133946 TaxID=3118909 RepID=UPI002F93003C